MVYYYTVDLIHNRLPVEY